MRKLPQSRTKPMMRMEYKRKYDTRHIYVLYATESALILYFLGRLGHVNNSNFSPPAHNGGCGFLLSLEWLTLFTQKSHHILNRVVCQTGQTYKRYLLASPSILYTVRSIFVIFEPFYHAFFFQRRYPYEKLDNLLIIMTILRIIY